MASRQLVVTIAEDSSGWNKFVGEGDRALGQLEGKLAGFAGKAKTAFLGVGVAAGAALVSGIMTGMDNNAATDRMAARLGLDPEEADRLGALSGGIYAQAWGDSLGEVQEAMGAVFSSFGEGFSDDELTDITTKVLDIANAFDMDVNEAVRATSAIMKNELAPDAESAIDLIVRGMQETGIAGDDLLEVFGEYSNQFGSMGLDGEAAMAMIIAAVDGGARSTDGAADSIKELYLRITEDADGPNQALADLGLNADDLREAIAEGGPAAEEAYRQVFAAIGSVEDPTEQARLAQELLGGTFEQVGLDAIEAMGNASGAVEGLEGASDRLGDTLNDNLSTKLEALKRTAVMKLAELGGVFVDAGSAIVDAFNEGGLAGVADLIGEKIGEAVDWLTNTGLPAFRTALSDGLSAIADWLGENLDDVIKAFVQWVIDAVPPLLVELGKIVFAIAQWVALDLIPALATAGADLVLAFLGWIGEALLQIPGKLGDVLSAIVSWFTDDAAPGVADEAKKLPEKFFEFVADIVTQLPGEMVKIVTRIGELIVEWYPQLLGFASGIALRLINFAAQFVGALPGQAGTMIAAITRAVTGWVRQLGNLAVLVATTIGGFAAEFISRLPGYAMSVITSITNAVIGWGTQLVNLGRLMVSKIIEGLAHLGQRIWDAIVAAWNWVKGKIGSLSPINLGSKIITNVPGSGIIGRIPIVGDMLPGRAHGGPVSAGAPYIVGEQGPEILVPNVSGTIIPNHRIGAGGGGSTVVNVNAGMVASAQQVRDLIRDVIRDELRMNPGSLTAAKV